MSNLTASLWERYRASGDPVARAQLLDAYLGLVHHAARELLPRLGPGAELDDLVGAGTLGLVQALETFEPARGLAFSTFAVPRIRGAILDEQRRREWQPRSARDRARRVEQARAAFTRRTGSDPGEHELAAELGVDVARYRRWREWLEPPSLVPLDAVAAHAEGAMPLRETIADPAARDPADALGESERRAALAAAIAALPERERLVLMLYYYEELNLKQIGEVLHVTESRASQVRTRALRRLRELAGWEEAA